LAASDVTLVTGATGFVGAAVARALQARGHNLRLLVRAGSDRRNLTGLRAELVEGNLAKPSSLPKAVRGCRYVFHVAADYRLWVPNPQMMRSVNVDGTLALLVAAHDAGVERCVYTSSVAALGLNKDGAPADERTRVDEAMLIGAYKKSKYDAQLGVERLAMAGHDIVIENPATPVGPGDVKPTPTGQLMLDAACGRMPAYVDTGLNIVHVDDVARGHLLAFERGVAGERYILGGKDMTLREILAELARLVGREPPRVRLPYAAVLPIAYIAEAFSRVSGRAGRVTLEGVRMSRKRMFFSSAKAQRELGYAWRPPVEAFADAVDWFRERGLISRQ